MKMLVFDTKDVERKFFELNVFKDFDVTLIESALNMKTELTQEQFDETAVISLFIHSEITEELLSKFKNLRLIATRSTGFNHIDIDACKKRHIAVLNVEDYGKTSVAQFAIGIMITLVRNVIPAIEDVKKQSACINCYNGRDLSNMTLGIIGTGTIGSQVAKIAFSLGMKILAFDVVNNDEIKDFAHYVEFDELITNSDIITLHTPYTESNYHLIGKEQLAKMKDGVYIINTARGELIDIEALYNSVISGKVKGVALDVLECEFLNFNDDNFTDNLSTAGSDCLSKTILAWKLLEKPNVILTPHIAYATYEAVNKILTDSLSGIKEYFNGGNANRVC